MNKINHKKIKKTVKSIILLVTIFVFALLTEMTNALTSSDQVNIDTTKQRLTDADLYNYITQIASENSIPPEIIYGLITAESGGKFDANSGLANGVMQITESTYNDASLIFPNKCTWEQYQTDKECQIRAGVALLKKAYMGIKGNTVYYQCNINCWGTIEQNGKNITGYWPNCIDGCSDKCIGPVNKTYSGWQAALRRYNGGGSSTPAQPGQQTSGCTNQPDYEYVEKVMNYADGWRSSMSESTPTPNVPSGTATEPPQSTTPNIITNKLGPALLTPEQMFYYDCDINLRKTSDWMNVYPNGFGSQIKVVVTNDALDVGGYNLNRKKFNTGLTENDLVIIYSKNTRIVNILYGKNINVQQLKLEDIRIQNAFNYNICKGFKQVIDAASVDLIRT